MIIQSHHDENGEKMRACILVIYSICFSSAVARVDPQILNPFSLLTVFLRSVLLGFNPNLTHSRTHLGRKTELRNFLSNQSAGMPVGGYLDG